MYTAYGGSRIETAVHKQVAKDHGFTDIADVDIMDENGSIELPVSDKAVNLKYDVVGADYNKYNSMIVLSHFKGHAMGGFGGAIKNISIGISSPRGKNYIHSGGHSETGLTTIHTKKILLMQKLKHLMKLEKTSLRLLH